MTYLHCTCLRTNPPGHHWECCPAFDAETMQTSAQTLGREREPRDLSPDEWLKQITCEAYPITTDDED